MARLIPAFSACVAVLLTTILWGAEPKEKAAFSYRLTKKNWKVDDKPVLLCDQKQGFGILSGTTAKFGSFRDSLEVRVDEQQNWYLIGKSTFEEGTGQALVIDRMTPRLFAPESEAFEWKRGEKPVKMIAADRGICFISTVTGNFTYHEDRVWIEKRADGFYWLNGKTDETGIDFGVRAIALKFNRAQAKKVTATSYRWSAKNEPLQMFPKTSGLCFITGIRGVLEGTNAGFALDVNADNVWTLSGQDDIEELQIDVIGLRWDGK